MVPVPTANDAGVGAGADLRALAVVIPAWQPGPGFAVIVRALVTAGFGWVLVVDDGSDAACAPVFWELAGIERVSVLRHAANLGKGRALKTAFAAVLEQHADGNELAGVVTADADAQHTPEDIARVGGALLAAGVGRAVLGVRRFGRGVPWRSRVGNVVAQRLFATFARRAVTDTQTGLRGLPVSLLPQLLLLEGERYEYEMAMLMYLCRRCATMPVEVPIQTVYLHGNRTSHFHPLRDSFRVYLTLMRWAIWPGNRTGDAARGKRR